MKAQRTCALRRGQHKIARLETESISTFGQWERKIDHGSLHKDGNRIEQVDRAQ
jgi:hypothetical protein